MIKSENQADPIIYLTDYHVDLIEEHVYTRQLALLALQQQYQIEELEKVTTESPEDIETISLLEDLLIDQAINIFTASDEVVGGLPEWNLLH